MVTRKCPKCGKTFVPQKQFGPAPDGELCFTWSNGHLPLMMAARVNNPHIIQMLIAAGADVNRGKDGITPLMVAANFGHLDAARALIENRADVKRECKTPDRLKNTISPVLLAAGVASLRRAPSTWLPATPSVALLDLLARRCA